ncbi:hypothetical protein D3C86_1737690 [compost metagenome]
MVNGMVITVTVMVAGSPSARAQSIPMFSSASLPICFCIISLALFPIGDSPSIRTPTTLGRSTITAATPIAIGTIVVTGCFVSSPSRQPTMTPMIAGSPNTPRRFCTLSKSTSSLFRPGIRSIILLTSSAKGNVQPIWIMVVQVVPSRP